MRGLKPSIQRIFLNNEKPVEFVPRGPEDVKAAEQATSYISYKFHQHNGYRILNDVFQDAMVKKTGIAYVYYNEQMRPEIHTYTGLNDEEFALIVEDDEVEVIEHEETTTETGAPAPTPTAEPIQTETAPAQPVESTSAKRADDILAMIRDRQQK